MKPEPTESDSNTNSGPPAATVSLVRRLAAIFYDMILLTAILVLASLIVVVPFQLTYGHPLYPLYVVYVYAIGFVYFGWFWIHGGQTLGMRTWGVTIVASNPSTRIGWQMALKRYLLAMISWLTLGGGFLISLFDEQNRTLHDRYSGTRLIRTSIKKK